MEEFTFDFATPGEGLIAGPSGALEVASLCPSKAADANLVVIVCHPHPLQGGTWTNKVVTTVCRYLNRLNLACVRFNFRGVGQSSGTYDEGVGESCDLISVIEWVTASYPHVRVALVGFSFGAFVAYRVAGQQVLAHLVLIAPPVPRYGFFDTSPTPLSFDHFPR